MNIKKNKYGDKKDILQLAKYIEKLTSFLNIF